MKETGIIMSGSHPRDILDGKKTMTRRTWGLEFVNENPNSWQFLRMEGDLAVFKQLYKTGSSWLPPLRSLPKDVRGEEPNLEFLIKCPYGQVGDRIWVRESYLYDPVIESGIVYKADNSEIPIVKWRSPLFMPRWASRITLEITKVRVERLQEITEDDAIKEGCEGKFINATGEPDWTFPQVEFHVLWDSLNAKRGYYRWETNPWVWVINWPNYSIKKTWRR